MENQWNQVNPPTERSPFWWLRWIPTIVVSVLIIYLLYVVGSLALVPLLASFALAYLLNPIVIQGEKRGLSRSISSVVAIFIVTVVIGLFLAYVLPDMWEEGSKAVSKVSKQFTPENAARQRAWLKRYSPALESVSGDKIEQLLKSPLEFYNENLSTKTTIIGENGEVKVENTGGGGSMIMSLLNSSLDLMLVPFFVFYILIDFQTWRKSIEGLIPPRFRLAFQRLFDESGRILESYVRSQILIGLIMAACYGVGFWFLDVPAWIGIALLAGLLNAIPYVGTLIGVVLACGFTVAHGGSAWNIIAVLGVFLAVQSLEGYVLTPKILGGRLNLHPMAVFLGLLIGGKLFGLLGFVLAIPTIAISKVFLKFLRELYEDSYFYHGGNFHPSKAPGENVEDRIAEAAENVLAGQEKHDEEDIDESNRENNEISIIEKDSIQTDDKII